jgi:hypothetical protein
MRNPFTLTIGVLALTVAATLAGCEKMDLPPDFRGNKTCKIKKIVFYDTYHGTYSGNFYYNHFGNPDSVIYEQVGTGEPDFRFIYDNKKRLRETYAYYGPGFLSYEQWHKYGYNNKNQIVIDTTYIFGVIGGNPDEDPHTIKRISYLEYDQYGRIVKDSIRSVVPALPDVVKQYDYDNDGNLLREGFVYDSYFNPHQLHPIWKFLDRDYSINNPISAVTYNRYRLPLRFDVQLAYPYSYTFLYESRHLNKSDIEYDCK